MKRFKFIHNAVALGLLTSGAAVLGGAAFAERAAVISSNQKLGKPDAHPTEIAGEFRAETKGLRRPESDQLFGRVSLDPQSIGRGTSGDTVNQATTSIDAPVSLNANARQLQVDFQLGTPGWNFTGINYGNWVWSSGGTAMHFGFSSDSSLVNFITPASNIVVPAKAAGDNVVVYDTGAATWDIVDRNSAVLAGAGIGFENTYIDDNWVLDTMATAMSADGNYVVFASNGAIVFDSAGNQRPGGATGDFGLIAYRFNRATSTLEVANPIWGFEGFDGPWAAGLAFIPAVMSVDVSADGQRVALDMGDPIYNNQAVNDALFAAANTTDILNGYVLAQGTPGIQPTAPDGTVMPPSGIGAGPVVAAAERNQSIYISTMTGGAPAQVVVSCNAAGAPAIFQSDDIYAVNISGSGRYVAFQGNSPTLGFDGTVGTDFIYYKDLVSSSPALPNALGPVNRVDATAGNAIIGNDGSANWPFVTKGTAGDAYAVFISSSENLATATGATFTPGEGLQLIFRKNLDTGALDLVSRLGGGTAWPADTNSCWHPSASADGNLVAFWYTGDDIAALGDSNANANDIVIVNMTADTARVFSKDTAGNQTVGGILGASISYDGTTVAFHTSDSTLDPTATSGRGHVYLLGGADAGGDPTSLDRIVAKPSSGGLFNGNSFSPGFSQRGHVMAFTSFATNVPVDLDANGTVGDAADADDNSNPDVFLKFLEVNDPAKVYDLVSVAFDGSYGGGPSGASSVPNFATSSVHPLDPPTSVEPYVLRRDDNLSGALEIEFDPNTIAETSAGFRVCFSSGADDLIDSSGAIDDSNGSFDVFVRTYDGAATSTQVVSINSTNDATPADGAFNGRISKDGNFVVYMSSSNDIRNSPNGQTPTGNNFHVYRRNMLTGLNTIVSVTPAGALTLQNNGLADLSDDGRYVAFTAFDASAYGTNTILVGQVVRADVFADGATPNFIAVSRFTEPAAPAVGQLGDWYSTNASISDDGSRVAFASSVDFLGLNTGSAATNGDGAQWTRSVLGSGTTTASKADIYLWDANTDSHDVVSFNGTKGAIINHTLPGPTVSTTFNAQSTHPEITGDGLYVAFWSTAENLLTAADEPYDSWKRQDESGKPTAASRLEHDIYLWSSADGNIDIKSIADSDPVAMDVSVILNIGNRPTRLGINNVASIVAGSTLDTTVEEDIVDINDAADIISFGVPALATPSPTTPAGATGSWDLYGME